VPQTRCARCGNRLIPVYRDQIEHPLCSPTDTGWIPRPLAHPAPHPLPVADAATLALHLAGQGWHVFPLSPASKRPLANCADCRELPGRTTHRVEDCACLEAERWCHGVRAATVDRERISAWWQREPDAIPGVAAGPSGLVLIDIDAHDQDPPSNPATELLPGIDLATEAVPGRLWPDPDQFRDGRDALRLLARIRGGTQPWPSDPGHCPVTVSTPSGGCHLWYRSPAEGLRQALSGPRGIAWQVDIKAGWSYGVAPAAIAATGPYRVVAGDTATPGDMPGWLAHEVRRVASPRPAPPAQLPAPRSAPGRRPAAYLSAVIRRGTAELATMTDGRQRFLSALSFKAGGLLAWSGLPDDEVTDWLVDAGVASGLAHNLAHRIVSRALARGVAAPLPTPASR
jgi:hypothetical protein